MLCCFLLTAIIHFSSIASPLALQRTLSPAVIFRGVDRAVGKVRPSTYLRQTLGVDQGPRTTMVGWKLQADTNTTVKERKKGERHHKPTWHRHEHRSINTEKPPTLLFLITDAEVWNNFKQTLNTKNPENTNMKKISVLKNQKGSLQTKDCLNT